MRRPVVAIYDVVDDQRRERVRAALRPIADHAQQSVWVVGPIPGLTVDRLAEGLRGLLGGGDRLRLYELCAACQRRARWEPATPRPFAWYRTQVVGGGSGPQPQQE